MSSDALHDGHRQRMRERLEKSGLASFQPHEVLEYLLFSFVPRRDTNELAHRLIKEFGSLSGVLNARVERLEQVRGMTYNAALFLSNLPDLFRLYLDDVNTPKLSIKGRGEARVFMGNKLFGVPHEVVYVAALDAHDQLIAAGEMSSGSGDSVDLSVRKVVDYALRNQASSILIAHNHPSGSVDPSQADINLTFQLIVTLESVGVKLQDHYIFCGSEYFSFEERGLLKKLAGLSDVKSILKEGVYVYV